MNYFMMIIGVQYIAAAIFEARRKSWLMVVVYVCYGVSAAALALVKVSK